MVIVFCLMLAAVGIYVFFRLYPPFGGVTPRRIKARSPQFIGGKFRNQVPTSMDMSLADTFGLLREFTRRDPARRPKQQLVPEPLTLGHLPKNVARITWFGHSAFLLQSGDVHILFDPMFGVSPSPFPALTSKRFSDSLPALPEDLPRIDAVVISHDHYDHLDYPSIRRLADKVDMFFVPIGLAAHLRRWGVPEGHITEMDWWEEATHAGVRFVCTPSRHFSGRTLTDRFATLWASWVVDTGPRKLFFSGDSGYGPHYNEIGDKYGPFDLTLMECGQYDRRWPNIHMTPEQTVQAHRDLRGKRMIPMHWGAFVLALHPWQEPVERVLKAGRKAGVVIMTPKIGESVRIGSASRSTTDWWK